MTMKTINVSFRKMEIFNRPSRLREHGIPVRVENPTEIVYRMIKAVDPKMEKITKWHEKRILKELFLKGELERPHGLIIDNGKNKVIIWCEPIFRGRTIKIDLTDKEMDIYNKNMLQR